MPVHEPFRTYVPRRRLAVIDAPTAHDLAAEMTTLAAAMFGLLLPPDDRTTPTPPALPSVPLPEVVSSPSGDRDHTAPVVPVPGPGPVATLESDDTPVAVGHRSTALLAEIAFLDD